MPKKFHAAMLAIVLLLALAPAAQAVVTCTQQIYFYDNSSGTGNGVALCAEDYPLVRSPRTGGSFDGGWYWQGTTISVDNKFTSYRWANTAHPGYRIKLYDSYYFNAGATLVLTRPEVGSGPFLIPSTFNNKASSFAGCGTSCADSPG